MLTKIPHKDVFTTQPSWPPAPPSMTEPAATMWRGRGGHQRRPPRLAGLAELLQPGVAAPGADLQVAAGLVVDRDGLPVSAAPGGANWADRD